MPAGNRRGHNNAIALTEEQHAADAAAATAPGANAPEPALPVDVPAEVEGQLPLLESASKGPQEPFTPAPPAGFEVVPGVPPVRTAADRYFDAVQHVRATRQTVRLTAFKGSAASAAQLIRKSFTGVSASSVKDIDTGVTSVYVFPQDPAVSEAVAQALDAQ